GVEQAVEVDVQEAARVLGPLDVAARPVERLGDAAEHQALSTQVSLLPPPCEELTTSEPSRSAARVSPPGTTDVTRLESTNGRRSTCAGRSSSRKIGMRLRASVGCAMNSRGSAWMRRRNSSRSSALETGPISIP